MTDRKAQIRRDLEGVRARTLALLARVPDDVLRVRVHDFYSPIGWHFGHVGRTEEFWAVGEALGRPLLDEGLSRLLADTPDNPKDARTAIPDRDGLVEYLARTRARVLAALDEADLDSPEPILRGGYAWEFALQHECQHQETVAEMLQLIAQRRPPAPVEPPPWVPGVEPGWVDLPGGVFTMGRDDPFGYDNEKPAHRVELAPFRLARHPVTAHDWTRFMADGGYARPELWSPEGWAWREGEGATMPEYWFRQGDAWAAFGPWGARALHPDEPAASLSAHEADAYARWAGARLPTEAEWEGAVAFAGGGARHPWGDAEPTPALANHGLARGRPTPVGAYPATHGLHDLAGNVWEWTASAFLPYDGFVAYPYDGYSKDHMEGRHRVCRGGSWATSPRILRRAFRNWYVPGYRQGFLGLRLASDG